MAVNILAWHYTPHLAIISARNCRFDLSIPPSNVSAHHLPRAVLPRLYLLCAVAAAIPVAPASAFALASHFSPPPAVVLAALQVDVHQVLEPGVAW